MFRTSYKIGKLLGIPIRLDISLLVVLYLLIRDFGPVTGLLLETGLLLSIVLHELGHSAVAMRKGCRVREINLTCLGGAAVMERIPTRPLDEFLMAIAGPMVSLVLGVALVFGGPYLPLPAYGQGIVHIIGRVNFMLLGFNLLPSFPMDGGRVLRAFLTPKFGRLRATAIAARLGRIMAVLFGIYAFVGFQNTNWFLVLIAFFIYVAAGNEYRQVQMQEAMKQGGYWFFNGTGGQEPEDRVEVSPPPYRRGRDTETDLYHDER